MQRSAKKQQLNPGMTETIVVGQSRDRESTGSTHLDECARYKVWWKHLSGTNSLMDELLGLHTNGGQDQY